VLLLLVAGCIDPIDAQWQLDHDHVVVARATPPRIHAGDTTSLDALVAHEGGPATVESPLSASTTAGTMLQSDGGWKLVAPDASTIAARGLPADGPVPVDVIMTFAHGTDRAADPIQVKKTVWIGDPSTNPDMPAITVAGEPPGDEIVVPLDQDVYLATTVPDGWRVNWLTSVGTLYQDDEPTSYLHVAKKDRQTGEVACVIRDDQGGVAWKVWPIHTE
jgi:hypothetical protein